MDLKNYDSALQYGATIGVGDMASGSIGSAQLIANSIIGSKSSLTKQYAIWSASTTGNTAVNILTGAGLTTAPIAGTIIGFSAVISAIGAGSGSVGSFSLWGTTAGTIATIVASGTTAVVGFALGTVGVSGSVAAGDTLQVSCPNNTGTATCYAIFQTAN